MTDVAASGSIDPNVFAALPVDIQEELLPLFHQNTFTYASTPASEPDDVSDAQIDAWSCRVCTFLNHPQLIECEICGALCIPLESDTHEEVETQVPNLGSLGSKVGQTLRRLRTSSIPTLSSHRDSISEESHEAVPTKLQLISSWKRQRSSSISALQKAAKPSVQAIKELTELQKDLTHKVVAGDDAFEASLEHLWRLVKDQDENQMFEKRTVNWVAMGFQNANPETDFRGGGILALKCLLYTFEAHPMEMRAIHQAQTPECHEHNHRKRWYPVCVAGINLTCLLAGLLQLGDGQFLGRKEVFWQLFEEPAAFYELFFYAFLKMDAIWHRLNATYMEFGGTYKNRQNIFLSTGKCFKRLACIVVLKVARKSVIFMLEQAPVTLMDLREASDQAFLDRFIVSFTAHSLAEWENGECPDPDHALETEDALIIAKTRASSKSATLIKDDAFYPLTYIKD